MSVLVALHVGRYVILGADTRQTLYDRDLKTVLAFNDSCPKIVVTPREGLTSGTGDVRLLEAVMARRPEAVDSGSLLSLITEEQQKVERDERCSAAVRARAVSSTGWVFTYASPDNQPRLTYYHRERGRAFWGDDPARASGHTLWTVGTGNGLVWLPECDGEEHRDAVHEELMARLAGGLQVCHPADPLKDSLAHHVALVLSVLDDAARQLPTSIGRRFTIGLHTEAGDTVMFEDPRGGAVEPV